MKGLYQRNGVWWMRFSINGRQIKKSTGTIDKRLAEKIYHKVMTDIAERRFFEVDEARQHTFNEMVEKFMREHAPRREIKTQKSYATSLVHLTSYFSGMLLADITPRGISDYYQKRKESGISIATVNREFAMLSKAFNLAWKRWEWVKENPCQKVQKEPENNEVNRWLTIEEAERLLSACSGYLNGQLPEIVTFALNTAMRQGEILNLKWNDVDLFRKVITVTKTKNKKPKSIPMTDTVYDLLLKKSKVVNMSGYIFATSNNTRHRARNVIREFEKTIAKAGIENFTFHCLRHTAATWMIQSGIDIYAVSKILGHKDIKTTMRYAHHYPESLRDGVKVLDNFMKNQGKKVLQNISFQDKISTKLAHSNNSGLPNVSNALI